MPLPRNLLKEYHEDLYDIGEYARIERGPPRLSAIATEELLSNERTVHWYTPGTNDAMGNPIVVGQPMVYVDWFRPRVEQGWYLFLKTDTGWEEVSYYDTKSKALEAAYKLDTERRKQL
jgi:hypothetical protein